MKQLGDGTMKSEDRRCHDSRDKGREQCVFDRYSAGVATFPAQTRSPPKVALKTMPARQYSNGRLVNVRVRELLCSLTNRRKQPCRHSGTCR
jgi:hypothetical protein